MMLSGKSRQCLALAAAFLASAITVPSVYAAEARKAAISRDAPLLLSAYSLFPIVIVLIALVVIVGPLPPRIASAQDLSDR